MRGSLVGVTHSPSPGVRGCPRGIRSLRPACASPSWLRWAAQAGSWGMGTPFLSAGAAVGFGARESSVSRMTAPLWNGAQSHRPRETRRSPARRTAPGDQRRPRGRRCWNRGRELFPSAEHPMPRWPVHPGGPPTPRTIERARTPENTHAPAHPVPAPLPPRRRCRPDLLRLVRSRRLGRLGRQSARRPSPPPVRAAAPHGRGRRRHARASDRDPQGRARETRRRSPRRRHDRIRLPFPEHRGRGRPLRGRRLRARRLATRPSRAPGGAPDLRRRRQAGGEGSRPPAGPRGGQRPVALVHL